MPLKDQVVTNLQNEARGVTALAHRTVRSGAYFYPIQGLAYFLSHRELWAPLTSRLLPLLGLSTMVLSLMFVFTYIPQSFVLQFVNGPLAWFTTIPLILGESATIISIVARMWFIDESLVDIFDAVLVQKGCENLVSKNRDVKGAASQSKSSFSPSSLGRTLRTPLKKFSPATLISNFILYAPLNFIPVIGPVVFFLIQARKNGPSYHERYFQLKSWNGSQKREFVDRNKEGYLGFGVVALVVMFVPAASVVFSFTNAVGAALWAADMEKGRYLSGQGVKKGSSGHSEGVSSNGQRTDVTTGGGASEVNGVVAGAATNGNTYEGRKEL